MGHRGTVAGYTALTVMADESGPSGPTVYRYKYFVSQDADQRPPKGPLTRSFVGADDEIRTRDPHLGKVMLYQLSHIRIGTDNLAVGSPDRTTRPAGTSQR